MTTTTVSPRATRARRTPPGGCARLYTAIAINSPESGRKRQSGLGPAQPFEKARFVEGKSLDFPSSGLDFPSLRFGFCFPRFAQKENSEAPRNSMDNNVNSTCVDAVESSPGQAFGRLDANAMLEVERRLAVCLGIAKVTKAAKPSVRMFAKAASAPAA
ncbi:MAG TPA: hypothetical protein VKG91_14995 [Roseiarcus sp.]|nr:hypothetical protein [Roseiarcus sp.]